MGKNTPKIKSTVDRVRSDRKYENVIEVPPIEQIRTVLVPTNYGARRKFGKLSWRLYSKVKQAEDGTLESTWRCDGVCIDGKKDCPCILHWRDDLKGHSKFWPGMQESTRSHKCILGNGSSYYVFGVSPLIEGRNAEDEEILVPINTSEAAVVGLQRHQTLLSKPITSLKVPEPETNNKQTDLSLILLV